MQFLNYLFVICLLSIFDHCCCAVLNPYRILGVSKSASIIEIRRAYKNLARKYHPDKTTDKNAEEKFIDINKAYEILTDPERRRLFDKTGQTEDSPNFRHSPDYSSFNRFDFDKFDTFFNSNNGARFKFTFNTGNYLRKHSITYRSYENFILPQSYTRPYLLVFYGDLCIPCVQMEQVLQKVINELEAVGVGFGTIHSQHETTLTRKIGVRSLPHLILLMDGDVRHYYENEISLLHLIEFIKRSLPKNLITEIDDKNYVEFLSGWRDNRVRVLFANSDSLIKLRYLLIAFHFRERIAFGRVLIGKNSEEIRQHYHIDSKMNSMLIFNEDIFRTQATLSVSELKTNLMKDILDSNKYLFLPRITSQSMFDHLCSINSLPSQARFCVTLIASDTLDNESKFEMMRNFIREADFPKNRFRFMYIFREKQPDFVQSLSNGFYSKKTSINRGVHVVILWRKESDHVYYEWLNTEWDVIDSNYINDTKQKLSTLINRLASNTAQFVHMARINTLIDESSRSLISRIVKRLLLVTENISDNISRTDPMPILSVILSVTFIVLVGYVMTYFMYELKKKFRLISLFRKIEEESIREKYKKLGRQVPGSSTRQKSEYKLNIHELRGETYNGLIRLLKPGCRTIVLFCDAISKPKLLFQFHKAVYPYRKNKTLLFSFLLVEKNIDWYKKLLLQTLGDDRDLNINPKNCIGTVISINGFRKYFCVYHAKLPEQQRRKPREENGEFLGMNDEEVLHSDQESDLESGVLVKNHRSHLDGSNLFEDENEFIYRNHLLDGLPIWLDKLFDGSATRYYINYWPEHMK